MIETGKELAAAAKNAASHKTVYGLGCFGWPMNQSNQDRAIASYAYNAKPEREQALRSADSETFAFDCVGFIKALLWGWSGDSSKPYGGAVYVSNGVPDKNANQMIGLCRDVTNDFSHIQPGEAVWMTGHIGIYLGDGLAAECTPKWTDGVQITAVHNIGKKTGCNGRTWTRHGKLPWITYDNSYTLHLVTLRMGSKSPAVQALQQLLIAKGFSCGHWGADGEFGAATMQAVQNFQRSMDLSTDGIAGPKTMAALLGVQQT